VSYLLDTNVLSELRRKKPSTAVTAWINERAASTFFLSVFTLGELRKGIENLSDDKRRRSLLDWLEVELPSFFTGRILSIDASVADRWGRMTAAAGRPVAAVDSLIGATAAHYGLTIVTRNVRDYAELGLDVVNPW
jgi:predicted nucleic acid-binding protein